MGAVKGKLCALSLMAVSADRDGGVFCDQGGPSWSQADCAVPRGEFCFVIRWEEAAPGWNVESECGLGKPRIKHVFCFHAFLKMMSACWEMEKQVSSTQTCSVQVVLNCIAQLWNFKVTNLLRERRVHPALVSVTFFLRSGCREVISKSLCSRKKSYYNFIDLKR